MVIVRDGDVRDLLIELLREIDLEAVVETVIPRGVVEPLVVLTDLGPRYDPRKASAALRRLRERWPQAPIVLLTSHRAATDDADQLGADALVLKPFDMDELTDTVRDVIARSGKREQAPRLRLGA